MSYWVKFEGELKILECIAGLFIIATKVVVIR